MNRKLDIVQKLKLSTYDICGLFQSLRAEELDIQVYSDGAKWSVKQVLAHLITIEKSMHWLFRNILEGGPGSPEDFDVERFNRSQPAKLDHLNASELLHRFKDVREETIAIVDQISESDLDRIGNHAFHGKGRLERFIRWAYEHAKIHEDEIRKVLKSVH